jgi:WXG100 family type VII secretion target
MANINVSYERMGEEARNLRAAKDQIHDQLRQLANRIQQLVSDGFVTDSASVKFHENYQQFTTATTNAVSALEDIAANLDNTARVLQETDQQLAGQ